MGWGSITRDRGSIIRDGGVLHGMGEYYMG